MTATISDPAGTARPVDDQAGPSLVWPAVVCVALFAVSLLIGVVFGGSVYTSPFIDDHKIQTFYTEHGTLIQFVAFFQFASSVALAVFTAVLWARLRQVAPGQAALTYTTAIGGTLAAAFLGLNAVVQWAMSHPLVIESAPVRRGLHYVFFGLGGFAHVAAIGVMVGGASLLALRARLLPGWFNVLALVFAGLGLLSTLTFVTESTTLLIPLGRFPTLIWQVAFALLLPKAATAAKAAKAAGAAR